MQRPHWPLPKLQGDPVCLMIFVEPNILVLKKSRMILDIENIHILRRFPGLKICINCTFLCKKMHSGCIFMHKTCTFNAFLCIKRTQLMHFTICISIRTTLFLILNYQYCRLYAILESRFQSNSSMLQIFKYGTLLQLSM